MANAPLPGRDGGSFRFDLGWPRSGLFLQPRLDGANHLELAGENRALKFRAAIVLSESICLIRAPHGDAKMDNSQTAAHYSKQWRKDTGYTDFIRSAPSAAKHTMARQLGWPDLFERIRAQATTRETHVYDAACGFGLIHRDLFAEPKPDHLHYLGADIHGELGSISNPFQNASFIQFDVSNPLELERTFDFVICRAALHHTPDPARTLRSLVSVLKPGGTLAISVYTKKTIMRDASDDALRAKIIPMSPDDALDVVKQFSKLGRDLQEAAGEITITQDLPFLGIKAGTYPIQTFIYDYFMKCWYNKEFGERSDIINFDWYHPPFAYRYSLGEIVAMCEQSGLSVVRTESNKAQHYVETKRLA
jgi:SAM-dependent methyltransferase